MTLPTHAITGLLIGTLTGHPVAGLIVGCFPDVDHMYSYVKHGYLKDWKTFYTNAFSKDDVSGDQRNILHNIIIAALICSIVFIVAPKFITVFSLAYISHLLLDALDTSDYFPLYPSKVLNIKGFIDFYSHQEMVLFIGLLLIYVSVLLS